jgi:hypothetical protein
LAKSTAIVFRSTLDFGYSSSLSFTDALAHQRASVKWESNLLSNQKSLFMRIDICGTGVDPYSFNEVIELICDHIKSNGDPQYVVTPNAQHIVLVRKNALFRQLYREAWLVVPDGVP